MLRIELHCHTEASHDGLITPEGLLQAARLQQLDAVAITDHDTLDGAREFQRWFQSRSNAPQILIGEEKTLEDGGHLIGLFLQHPIASGDFSAAVDEIHEQGGLALLPHPFRPKDGILSPRFQHADALQKVDGIEVHNAKGCDRDNRLAAEADLPSAMVAFGGSDAHYEADVGTCVNEIDHPGAPGDAVRDLFHKHVPYAIHARQQATGEDERRYAPTYYAVKRFVPLPKKLLPTAKQVYRRFWNLRHGGQRHPLVEIHRHPIPGDA